MTTATTQLLLRDLKPSAIRKIRYRYQGQTTSLFSEAADAIDQLIDTYPLLEIEWREDQGCFSITRTTRELGTFMVFMKDEAMEQTEHEQWCVREVTGSAQQLLAGVLDKAGDLLKAAAKRASEHADHPDNQNPALSADLVRLVLETLRDDPPYDLLQLLKASDAHGELPNFEFTLDDCRDNMMGLFKSLIKGVDDGSANAAGNVCGCSAACVAGRVSDDGDGSDRDSRPSGGG